MLFTDSTVRVIEGAKWSERGGGINEGGEREEKRRGESSSSSSCRWVTPRYKVPRRKSRESQSQGKVGNSTHCLIR